MGKNKVSPEQNKNFKRNNGKFFIKNKIKFNNKNNKSNIQNDNELNKNQQSFFIKSDNSRSKNEQIKSSGFFVKPTKNMKPSSSSNHNNIENEKSNHDKKGAEIKNKRPFDKKKWRLQKYSKKYKLEKWEETRKKSVLKEYYKEIKDDKNVDVQKIYKEEQERLTLDDQSLTTEENENNLNTDIRLGQTKQIASTSSSLISETSPKATKKTAYQKAHLEFKRIKEEKKQRREELARKKAERDEALKLYKEKKVQKFKTLNRKTKKGQPIMKDRMEMLLAQIQKNINNE